eukprot:6567843-Heterocapsa_arctica.AAC.1
MVLGGELVVGLAAQKGGRVVCQDVSGKLCIRVQRSACLFNCADREDIEPSPSILYDIIV